MDLEDYKEKKILKEIAEDYYYLKKNECYIINIMYLYSISSSMLIDF